MDYVVTEICVTEVASASLLIHSHRFGEYATYRYHYLLVIVFPNFWPIWTEDIQYCLVQLYRVWHG